MKVLKIIGLGIAMWSLSLLWPDVNLILTTRVMIGVIGGLGVAELVYILAQRSGQNSNSDGAKHNHLSQPISPVAPIL